MKRGTEHLLKFKKLKLRLGLSTWETKGLLQSIWDLAAENAILGDVGRFSNADIAFGVEYAKDPDDLIAALVECRWLDVDPTYRLIIHDWFDHCEDWIKKRIFRERGFETWTDFLESWRTSRQTEADKGRQPQPRPTSLTPAADNVRQVADNGGQCPLPADGGSQIPTEADDGSQRQPTAEDGDVRQTLDACLGLGLGLGHEPEPSHSHPPVAPLAGGEARPGRNGQRRKRRDSASQEARTFVAHVYAAWAGSETPVVTVLEKEAQAAESLLACLREVDPEGGPEEWAAEFAGHVRQRADLEDKARNNVALALPRYSASFVAHVPPWRQEQARRRIEDARWAHQERFTPQWLAYVEGVYAAVQAQEPERCKTWREKLSRQLGRDPTDEERLERFAEDARKSEVEVFSFWQWDERMNPEGFGKQEAVKA